MDTHRRFEGVRVLVAEDTPGNQRLIAAWLAAFGCRTDIAANGVEAVEMATANEYDVVLMDVMMPEMDGLEATRVIRAVGFTRLPIIALTASVTTDDRERVEAAGLDDFLSKPIDSDQLQAILHKWTDRERCVTAGEVLA